MWLRRFGDWRFFNSKSSSLHHTSQQKGCCIPLRSHNGCAQRLFLHCFGGIGFFNKKDSTRKGGTGQLLLSAVQRQLSEKLQVCRAAGAPRCQLMRALRALVSLALLPGLAEAQGAPGHACTHDLKRAHNSRPRVHRRSIRTEPLAGSGQWAAR